MFCVIILDRRTPDQLDAHQMAAKCCCDYYLSLTNPGSSKTASDFKLFPSCEEPSFGILDRKVEKKKHDELEISNVDSSVHNTSFQSSVVHWWCFMRQPSLFCLFWHVSNGFLAAIQPVKPEVYSLKLNWDVLITITSKLCLELPILQAADFQKLVLWFCHELCTSPPDFPLVSEWLLIVKETPHWHFMKFYNGLFLFYC